MEALHFFYYKIGDKLWKDYGFIDAFNLTADWYDTQYIATHYHPWYHFHKSWYLHDISALNLYTIFHYLAEKYKAELLSLFDRLKIENMPDVYSQGNPFSVEQEFFKQDKLFLLYVPNKKKAQSFRQVRCV